MLSPLQKKQALGAGVVVVGVALVIALIKTDEKKGKFNRVQLVIENELPLKLQIINDATESLVISKDIQFKQTQDIVKVLKHKYNALLNSVVEVCGYFKLNFDEYLSMFDEKYRDFNWAKSDLAIKNRMIRFDWNKKFGVKQYRAVLEKYLEMLNQYELSQDYLSFILQENRFYREICAEYDLNEECLLGACLKFNSRLGISKLIKQIQEKQSKIVLNIDSILLNKEG